MKILSCCEVASSLSAKTDLSGILGVCQKVFLILNKLREKLNFPELQW